MSEKQEKLQTFDLSYFLGKSFLGDGGFQNILVYQTTSNTLELNVGCNVKPLFNPLSLKIKRFGCKVGMQFLNDFLLVENKNYLTKLVNSYIVYDLNCWPRNP